MNFKNKHIISIRDMSKAELDYILAKAALLKNNKDYIVLECTFELVEGNKQEKLCI